MVAQPPELTDSQVGRALGVKSRYGGGGISADAFLSLGCMEGMFDHIVEAAPTRVAKPAGPTIVSGYVLVGAVTSVAYIIHALPIPSIGVISTIVIAILLGMIVRNVLPLPGSVRPGCKHLIRKGIPIAIVLTGAGLNLHVMQAVGVRAMIITALCVVIAVSAGYYLGRLFGLPSRAAMLLGVGTGICGNSAIVAVAPLIDADDDDLVLSVGAINLLGFLVMLLLPIAGKWLALDGRAFGIWAGTSIHAVPQVVAAGFVHSDQAGELATVVKLFRVVLLAPMVFILALAHARQKAASAGASGDGLRIHYARFVPWFVWGFVACALMGTFGLLPTLSFPIAGSSHDIDLPVAMKTAGKVLLTLSVAAIGLEVDIRQLAGVGGRALLAGLAAAIVLAVSSLIAIKILIP